jgi:hypothetical protein
VCLVRLILGFKPRTATVLRLLFAVSLDHRNPLLVSHADRLFRLFVALGEQWSLDAVQRDSDSREEFAALGSTVLLS